MQRERNNECFVLSLYLETPKSIVSELHSACTHTESKVHSRLGTRKSVMRLQFQLSAGKFLRPIQTLLFFS